MDLNCYAVPLFACTSKLCKKKALIEQTNTCTNMQKIPRKKRESGFGYSFLR